MDIKTLGIWGLDANDVITYGKKYRNRCLVVYFLDILAMVTAVIVMYNSNSNFGTYMNVMFMLVIVCSVALNIRVKEDKVRAYKLYCSAKKLTVGVLHIKVTANELYSQLYKLYKSKLKEEDTLDNYVTVINESCKMKDNYASKIFKSLSSLKDSTNGNDLYCYYVKVGRTRKSVLVTTSEVLVSKKTADTAISKDSDKGNKF